MFCIAICGDSASGKTVMAELLAKELGDVTILECDRYHKWERNDQRWISEYTHLNPQANDIDLLYQDVLALKDGKSILRRNYDHSTGTFTEVHEIKPARYLIVVGLHTLMHAELYDLTIFMDPDPAVKIMWKIARDMSKRGYTYKQVTEQIERRKADYESFVKPLQAHASFVIQMPDDSIIAKIVNQCKTI